MRLGKFIRYSKAGIIALLTMLSVAVSAQSYSVSEFSGARIDYQKKHNVTYIKSGKNVNIGFVVQLNQIPDQQVKISPEGYLTIDISNWKPEKHGASKTIRIWFPKEDAKKLAAKNVAASVTISADRDGSGTLFGEGRANDKHYYFHKYIRFKKEKQTLDASKVTPENLQSLAIRLDVKTPAVYHIYSASISVAAEQNKQADKRHVPEGINLLKNGDAEWGFYNAMWNNPLLREQNGKVYYGGRELTGRNSFAIDENEKYSGRRSFRCNGEKNAWGDMYFAPVPYVPKKKVYLSFYAKAKINGTRLNPVLYLAPGQAYGYTRPVILTDSWKKYQLPAIVWGQKEGDGYKASGDPLNGYGCLYGSTMPRFSSDGLAWIDNISYSIGKPASDDTKLKELNILGKLDHGDGLYQIGENVTADLVFENTSALQKKYKINTEFIDFKGDSEEVKTLDTIELAPGETRRIKFSGIPQKRGLFILNVKATNLATKKAYNYNFIGGTVPAAEKRIRRFATDAASERNMAPTTQYLAKFGIGTVRLWSQYRDWKKGGEYTGFRNIPLFHKAGMWIILNVQPPDIYGRAPKDMSEVKSRWTKEFAATARYVNCFEILNEPNIWVNRAKADPAYEDMSSTAYVRFLKAANDVFRKLNPKALIAGPATCHTDINFTSAVLATGGAKYLDAITEHPYRNKPELPDYDEDLKALHKVTGTKPVYSTENGSRFPAIIRDNQPGAIYLEQMADSMRMLLIAYGCGNEIYVNFAWENMPNGMIWQLFMGGNPDNNGMPRPAPALYATRAMADIIGDAPTLGRLKLGSECRSYMFDKGSQRVAAIWKFDGPEAIVDLSKVPGKAKLLDMMGNPLKLNKAPLNQFPVYLVTDAPPEAIREYFRGIDLGGKQAVTASMRITGIKQVGVNIANMRNRAVKGSVKMGSIVKTFELKAEESKLVTFDSSRSISTEPELFTAEVKVNGVASILTVKKALRAMFAEHAANELKIDGDLSDWPAGKLIILNYKNAISYIDWTQDEKKVTANIRTAWDDDFLYIAVTVHKKGFYPTNRQEVWEGDGLQLAFDTICNGKKGAGYADDDFEYGIAQQHGKAEVYRRHASSASYDSLPKIIGKLDGSEVKACVRKYADRQVYEMAFSRRAVSPFRLEAGNTMNWDLIINMSNGKKRIGYLEITPGIGKTKAPYMFMPLILKK